MSLIEWIIIGVLGLAMFVISARVMRKGLPTLDENRRNWQENIHQTEMAIEKDRKNISSSEQLQLLKAAVEDLVRLEGMPQGYEVLEKDGMVELNTPEGSWKVRLLMREKGLKGSKRTLHGKCRWQLEGFGFDESYLDMASLMRSLNGHLHDGSRENDRDDRSHILRRMTHLPQEPGQRKRR